MQGSSDGYVWPAGAETVLTFGITLGKIKTRTAANILFTKMPWYPQVSCCCLTWTWRKLGELVSAKLIQLFSPVGCDARSLLSASHSSNALLWRNVIEFYTEKQAEGTDLWSHSQIHRWLIPPQPKNSLTKQKPRYLNLAHRLLTGKPSITATQLLALLLPSCSVHFHALFIHAFVSTFL